MQEILEYIVKNLDGNQFFDKSNVKFIYMKIDDTQIEN